MRTWNMRSGSRPGPSRARTTRRSPRRPGAKGNWPARTRATRSCSPRTDSSTSGTRSTSRCGSSGRRPRPGWSCSRDSGSCSSTSSRTRTVPSRSSSRSSPSRTGTSRSSATTTSRSTSSAARRSATSSGSATATRTRGQSSSGATTGRSPRSSTRPTGWSASTIRIGSRFGRGSPSACARSAAPARTSPAVRLEAFATHAEEADWIAAEIAARIEAGARPRDLAVLVRANGHADPILRSLNVAGIPWRFSGTSGLYARPEVRRLLAFLRAVADPTSSVDVYALATSEPYGLGGEDLTSIVNTARRRHRSIWEILDELERQPGILRLSDATRTAASRFVADLRRFTRAGPSSGPPARSSTGSCATPGSLARLAASDTVAAEEALRNIARFFDIVRAQSAAARRRPGDRSSPATSRR